MQDIKHLKIGVLAGGPSNERDISLESGKAVLAALREMGLEAVFIDVKKELTHRELSDLGIDAAFIALHGRFGEDGTIQRILEECRIPYTGSGPAASGLALDKIASREVFIRHGMDVPRYIALDRKFAYAEFRRIAQDFDFPLVIKPQFEGSSIGISIVGDKDGLAEAITMAFGYGDRILIEEHVNGRELTVGILNDEPLPVIEIAVKEQFYNFTAKYNRADTEYIVPARIKEEVYERAQAMARSAHIALGCSVFSRADMIWDEGRGRLVLLEVNSIPGFTSHSLLPKAAACAGIEFRNLCLKIIEGALRKKNDGQKI